MFRLRGFEAVEFRVLGCCEVGKTMNVLEGLGFIVPLK